MTQRFCLALDLKDDPALIEQYEAHHRRVWPEILASITASGIVSMEIYRVENRLFMVVEAGPNFSFAAKQRLDAADAKVGEWEALMSRFQLPLPGSAPGEKWRLMSRVFQLGPA